MLPQSGVYLPLICTENRVSRWHSCWKRHSQESIELPRKKPPHNMHVGAAFRMGTNFPMFSLQNMGFQAKLLVWIPLAVVFTERQAFINIIISWIFHSYYKTICSLEMPISDDYKVDLDYHHSWLKLNEIAPDFTYCPINNV